MIHSAIFVGVLFNPREKNKETDKQRSLCQFSCNLFYISKREEKLSLVHKPKYITKFAVLPNQNRESHMEIPEKILLHVVFKNIQSTNQNAELTVGIRPLIFS